jgi:MFS family permease
LLTKRSNKWLILEGFIATLGLGAMIWLPRLFTAKVQAEGFGLETATVFGSTLSLVFQSGSYFAIPAGFLGDLWQRRSLRGRALLSTIGITAAVPFHIAFFLMPLGKLIIPEEKGMIQIALATLSAVFSNGTIALAFVVAVLASVLLAIDGPNRAALITDVNLPEHRGTVVGLAFLASGFGAALGNLLSGLFFTWLARFFDSPWHYAIGMSLFTLFLLPAGWCYYQVSKSSSEDILTVQQALAERASFQPEPPSADSPSTLAVDPQTKPLP